MYLHTYLSIYIYTYISIYFNIFLSISLFLHLFYMSACLLYIAAMKTQYRSGINKVLILILKNTLISIG